MYVSVFFSEKIFYEKRYLNALFLNGYRSDVGVQLPGRGRHQCCVSLRVRHLKCFSGAFHLHPLYNAREKGARLIIN